MHNKLKITDMQTLESNKNTSVENSMDENSIDWYHKTINEVTKFKKIIIATNNKDDFKKNEVNIIQLDQIKKNY